MTDITQNMTAFSIKMRKKKSLKRWKQSQKSFLEVVSNKR